MNMENNFNKEACNDQSKSIGCVPVNGRSSHLEIKFRTIAVVKYEGSVT